MLSYLLQIITFILLLYICQSQSEFDENSTSKSLLDRFAIRKNCKMWKKKFNVRPGQSWGSLTTEQQNQWMSWNCDEFFCKPHHLAGKGVYKCEKISDSEGGEES
jgi:hypothetical protein